MFERFTERARRVVVLAQEEARRLNHDYIGTEHILLGLLNEGRAVAAGALESLGISLEAVRRQVEEIIGQGQARPTGHIPFTPRSKKVLELSLREALRLGHHDIGTEHLLLALVREGEGVAAQVLTKLGADLSAVQQTVVRLLAEHEGEPPAEKRRVSVGASARGAILGRALEPEEMPGCAHCGSALQETFSFRRLDAREGGGEATRAAIVVFCGRCGTALGVLPPDGA